MLTSTVCQPPMPADVIANALLGKGIGNILFPRTVGFPHCLQRYNKPVKITTCGLICINVYNNRSWRHTFNPDISCSIAVCQTCKARQRIYYRQRQYDYILFSCPTIKSPLFTRPQGRYKVCRRNSYSNNQKRLLLLSNLRDDNGRYFQWCCCEHYLQRHNTL